MPVGFALDPLFDALGVALLSGVPALQPVWTLLYNMPVVPLTNFNNSVVLGGVVSWVVLSVPLFFASRWAVARYRATVYRRLQTTRAFQMVKASKVYNVYRLIRP